MAIIRKGFARKVFLNKVKKQVEKAWKQGGIKRKSVTLQPLSRVDSI